MKKSFLLFFNVFLLAILSSCTNVFTPQNKASISFSIGKEAAKTITDTVSKSSQVTDDTFFDISCTFDGLKIKPEEVSVTKNNLANAEFKFNDIPFDKKFQILLDVSFNDIIIYQGESDFVILTEKTDGLDVNINIHQKNSKITYEPNDGKFKNPEFNKNFTEEYFITDDITKINLPVVEKEGYTFDGWYFDKQCTKPVESLGKNNYVGDVKLFAKWNINHYTISYSTGTEQVIKEKIVEYGYKITAEDLPVIEKKDSDYIGWYIGDNKAEPGYIIKSDTMLTCYWQDWNSVSEVIFSVTGDVDYDDSVELTCATTNADIYYTTDNSDPVTSLSRAKFISSNPIKIKNDITIKAYAEVPGSKLSASAVKESPYRVKKYNVIFNTKYGAVPEKVTGLKKGDRLQEPEKPLYTGYIFGGWYISDKFEEHEKWDFAVNTIKSSNIALYGKWTPITYTIKFDGNESTSGSTEEQIFTYDKAETLNANGFKKTGYVFTGWNTKKDGLGDSFTDGQNKIFNLSDTNNIVTLYAQWNAGTYTVKFDGNGSTSGSTDQQTMTYDKQEILTTNGFKKTGYNFTGWNTQKNGSGDSFTDGQSKIFNLQAAVNGNATLYAQWAPITYTINFNINGGSEKIDSITCTYDKPFAMPGYQNNRSGFTSLNKWTQNSDGSGSSYDAGAQCSSNLCDTDNGSVTIYAKWNDDNPGPVTGLKELPGNTMVSLSWATNPTEEDVDHIEIEYGTYSTEGSKTAVKTITVAKTEHAKDITALTNGTKYYFDVKAVDKGKNYSTASSIDCYPNALPTINQFSIPDCGTKKSGQPLYIGVEVSGMTKSQYKAEYFDISGSLASGAKLDILNDTLLRITTTIPNSAGGYNLTVNCKKGPKVSGSMTVKNTSKYNTGDVLLSNGSIVPGSQAASHKSDAIGIVFVTSHGSAFAVGLEESSRVDWGYNVNGNVLECGVYNLAGDFRKDAGSAVIFTKNIKGSDNWNEICKANPEESSKPEDFPPMKYALEYGTTAKLSGTYASGWFVPSEMELCELFKVMGTVNNTISQLGKKLLGEGVNTENIRGYWSGSGSATHAWYINFRQPENHYGNYAFGFTNQTSRDPNYGCQVRVVRELP